MTTNETKCRIALRCCLFGAITGGSVHDAECKPDALTRLERLLMGDSFDWTSTPAALVVLEEAREEMEALRDEATQMRNERDAQRKLKLLADDVAATLSGQSSETLRMGQQQGRAELAQELIALIDETGFLDVERMLHDLVDEDAGQ
jgi:hypothetical protein